MTAPPDPVALRLVEAAEAERRGQIDAAAALIAGLGAALDDRPLGLHLAGSIAARRDRYGEAAGFLERAVTQARLARFAPSALAAIHRDLIEVYRRLSRYDDAMAAAEAALALCPDDPVTLNNLGVLHAGRLDDAAAIAAFDRAIALDPDTARARLGRGEIKLAQGDYAAGWADYAWRFRLPGVAPPIAPQLVAQNGARGWDGARIGGTLLLVADQGFGDVIQFARYLPWAAARCARLVVAASPEMRPVIAQFPQVASLTTEWPGAGPFEAWATFSDLPRLAGTRIDTIPLDIPYLAADPALTAQWQARLDQLAAPGTRRIGLVWGGRTTHSNDFARSVPLPELTAFADLPGVTWVSLQKGEQQWDIGHYFGRTPLVNLGGVIADYADTMAVIATLDLVVTVDTSVAHLAGAMGRPVWIMLPYLADWRWGRGGTAAPWYPTAKLFRQPAPMAWDVIADIVSKSITTRNSETK